MLLVLTFCINLMHDDWDVYYERGRKPKESILTYEATRSEGDYRRKVLLFDVALDLLKRHSGIVWDPGRFRGIAPRRGREEVGEPCGRTRPNPHALAMPGATQLTVKSP